MRYTVLVTAEDGAFAVRVPALPGCFTQGRTLDEALARASEAVSGHVGALRNLGEPVPGEVVPPIVASVESRAEV